MTEIVSLFVATMGQAAALARWYVDHLQQVVMWALVADVLVWSAVGAIHLARRRRGLVERSGTLVGITGA